ncbi:hypothetical protein D6C98_05748 [Aureobasidium pullulans]|nr:hypothetical protein D6C98_05748 [Aureobasidium pullulans]
MENSGTSASTLDKKWSSSGWNGKFYWYRTIGRSGKTWFQCGISANDRTPSSGKPSHFFTCKLMPRVGYTEQKIMKACEETAKALKFHRGPTGGRCDSCDFRNVQENLELSDDPSAGEWTFVPEESSPSKAYWTRTVKSGDETWNQYGVSKGHQTAHDDQPDFSFTCKNTPREGKSEQYIGLKMHSPSITIITIIIIFFFFLLGLASPAPLSRSGASPVPAVSYLNSVPTLALNTIFPSSVQTSAATAPPVNCPVTIIYVPVYVTQTIITEPESSSPSPGLHMSGPTS